MIEKITLELYGESQFRPEDGKRCEEMNSKELLLYAAALCSGRTALDIMRKERITPRRFEIAYSGELTPENHAPGELFRSFHVVYNVACDSEDDQVKVSRALELTHEKYCGMTQLLRRIAPVSHEIAIVSTEQAEA